MEYDDCMAVLKSYFTEVGNGGPEHLLTSGDVYAGNKSKESADYFQYLKSRTGGNAGAGVGGGHGGGQQQAGFQQNVKRPFSKGGQRTPGQGDNRSGGGAQRNPILNRLCRDYNRGQCSKTSQTCRFEHKCNKMVSHTLPKTGKVVNDWICQEQHPASQCKK